MVTLEDVNPSVECLFFTRYEKMTMFHYSDINRFEILIIHSISVKETSSRRLWSGRLAYNFQRASMDSRPSSPDDIQTEHSRVKASFHFKI